MLSFTLELKEQNFLPHFGSLGTFTKELFFFKGLVLFPVT